MWYGSRETGVPGGDDIPLVMEGLIMGNTGRALYDAVGEPEA